MLFRFWVFPDCTFLDISRRMPPHPEHIGDIMLAFRSIRMWKNI